MECIILAGGLGTRLQGVIGAYPKCMAPVNGKPFLHYIFEYLSHEGCTHAILSLGYKHEVITDWLQTLSLPFTVAYVVEEEPLGTGGGIQLALRSATTENVLILNGDTMFRVHAAELYAFHTKCKSSATLALKAMRNFDRYGIVKTDEDNIITAFEEKQCRDEGLINGGVYVVNKAAMVAKNLPLKFSFEKDYLENFAAERTFYGFTDDAYFIDIGIPQDYERAQNEFK